MTIFTVQKLNISRSLFVLLTFFMLLSMAAPTSAASAAVRQKRFTSPAEAVKGLVEAVKSNDNKVIKYILGPESEELVSSGDPVTDQADRDRFIQLYNEKNRLEQKNGTTAVLTLGKEDFPFPLPLVHKGRMWVFDTKAGKKEILNRRIGRNELAVMEVMKNYLEAQREYTRMDHDGNGVLEFARKLNSKAGTQDGLYWEVKEGEEPSPLGPLMARADCEGYDSTLFEDTSPEPFHGYYFKVLMKQGKNADGGAFDYLVNDKMVLGFALIAYPAKYRASGVMTFIVNQSGTMYQKDLGANTAASAAKITSFDPDKTWKKVEP